MVRPKRTRPDRGKAAPFEITEARAVLAEHEHSISLLRATIESTADGILVVDTVGKVRLLNKRFLDLWQIPREVATLRDDDVMIAFVLDQLRDPDAFQSRIRELYAQPEKESVDVLEFRDGRVVERYSRPQRLDHDVVGRVWSFRDVTEQRHNARALREHARIQSFFARTSSQLAESLGFDKTVHRVARLAVPRLADWCVINFTDNGAGTRRVACAHRDASKEPLLDRLPPSCPTDPDASVEEAERRAQEPRIVRVPEDVTLEEAASQPGCATALEDLGLRAFMRVPLVARGQVLGEILVVRTAERAGWSDVERAVVMEFAYRAALAVDNAHLYETAIEANRAKSDFLAVMSHELRTPLNAIVGYANLMEAGIPVPLAAPQKGQLSRIQASTRHLIELIEDVLTLSRLEAGREEIHMESIELTELTREVAALVEPSFKEKGLALDLELPDPPVRVETDPGKVRQILLNLLSNAAKFTERGHTDVVMRAEPSQVSITVADTGIGISIADRKRVFEPFTQVEHGATRRHGGTGLGLSVSRHLARLLGGDLTAASEPGEGSRFTLALPKQASKADDSGG